MAGGKGSARLGSSTRLALVGAGAIAKLGHVPAMRALGMNAAVIVDPALSRAQALAGRKTRICERLDDCIDDFDAAIVAVPHRAHRVVVEHLLEAGKHVLLEKPLAADLSDGEAIAAAAERSGASLRIAHFRRHLDSFAYANEMIGKGQLGEVLEVWLQEGGPYGWPLESGAMWDRSEAGGGVLLDGGSHVLDAVVGWFGNLRVEGYADDSDGGVEAECTLEFTAGTTKGHMRLSRLRKLMPMARIIGTQKTLDVSLVRNEVWVQSSNDGRSAPSHVELPFVRPDQLFERQLRGWLDHIERGQLSVLPTAADGLTVMAAVDKAYNVREELKFPWRS